MNMDMVTDLRIAFTVVTFVTFVSIVIWAYSKRARSDFDEAELLPLDEVTGTPAAGLSRSATEQGRG